MAVEILPLDLRASLRPPASTPSAARGDIVRGPADVFARILGNSTPQSGAAAPGAGAPQADLRTVLERSFFRDLIASFGQGIRSAGTGGTPARSLPEAPTGAEPALASPPRPRQAVPTGAASSALSLFNTIQSMGAGNLPDSPSRRLRASA